MKPLLILPLLFSALTAIQAQDFRALPPSEQPNAAELAYFGSKYPNLTAENILDSASVRLVTGFLNDIMEGQFEAAHERIANKFRAYGPGLYDFLVADELFTQWEHNGRLFADQQLIIEDKKFVSVLDGDRQGTWVYVKGVWLARDNRYPGKSVRIPFYELAQVRDGKIQKTYTSYGNDQLFYDLGFPLYTTQPEVTQNR
ncbi:hypothetical protein DYU11_05365 [Fibrisoma montanum]|uniref:Nuclear transport factor 2 family protein n=1 Tax=Fibrisoma montanum TaxID=2305895 RepID=A0A418MK17_9BACT|nr:hypothetical protein [Fibrisoma montanum]RIV27730.1 hypothetical protein DYU11_05365 [Fibrisoma montanum]